MKHAQELAEKLVDSLKCLNLKCDVKENSIEINGIEIVKDLVPVKTIAGEQMKDGYIASVPVVTPSNRWDEPDCVDEVTIYEGRNLESAVRATIDALIKEHLDGYIESLFEQKLELEEFEQEHVQGI